MKKENKGRGRIISTAILAALLAILTAGAFATQYSNYRSGQTPSMGHFYVVVIADIVLMVCWLVKDRIVRQIEKHRILYAVLNAAAYAAFFPALFYITQRQVYGSWVLLSSRYFLLNMVVLALLHLIITFISGSMGLATWILGIGLDALALTSYYLQSFRGKPLMIFDFMSLGTAATVAGDYQLFLTVRISLMTQAVLGIVIVVSALQTFKIRRTKKGTIGRIAGLASSVVVLVIFSNVYLSSSYLDKLDFWRLNRTYGRKGYLTTLIAEISCVNVQAPEGYSVEKVEQLTKLAASGGEAASETAAPTNLIVIMNESFFDPADLGTVDTDSELLPFWRSLTSSGTVSTGRLYVPVRGSGTSNTEYEVLTGNTTYFLPSEVTVYDAWCHDPEYGMASTLKAQGYHTVAMHPLNASNWNRSNVYPWMQFDEFESKENWGDSDVETIRGKASDAACYKRIEERYEAKEEGEKMFTFLVTLQNHGGYTEDTWTDGFEPSVKLNYESDYPRAETYLTLINESDSAFEDLISYFDQVDEPTMIVMFGDHQPWVESGFLEELTDSGTGDTSIPSREKYYFTQYVIWANYDIPTVEKDISANYLGDYVLQMAGLETTPYNDLVLETMQTVPVFGYADLMDSDGNWYSEKEVPDTLSEAVNNYNIVEYNDIFDRKHLVTDAFTIAQ